MRSLTIVKRKNKKPQDVQERRHNRSKKRWRAGAKRENGDTKGGTLVIKTKKYKDSEVLKAMTSDAKLVNLGVDVRSTRHTRTGEIILELKHGNEHKGVFYKCLAEEVLGEGR